MSRIEHIGDATLYLGDCRDILPTLGKMDAVVTDPPFDSKTHDGALVSIDFKPLDDLPALTQMLLTASRGWVLAFCSFEMLGEYSAASGAEWVRAGIWDKVINMPQMTGDRPAQGGEALAIMHPKGRKRWNGGGKAAIWRHMVDRGEKEHPTQKPVSLMSELLGLFTQPGDVVLDPFMGGASTGVACLALGRKFIGIEIEPKYFDIACRRIDQAYKQPRLFKDEAPKPVQASFLGPES